MEMDTSRRMGNYKEAVDAWARWRIVPEILSSVVNLWRAYDKGGAHGLRSLAAWPASHPVEVSYVSLSS